MKRRKERDVQKIWDNFKKNLDLTEEQLVKFKDYAELLLEWNKNINLTAIKDLSGIIRQHFIDSLVLKDYLDLNKIKTMADIGPGPGFPSVPLKILFPHLKLFLIEVNKKKQKFLNALFIALDLKDVEIVDLDWRTFLRTTDANIDLFVTRAAINELELCRMFKPACPYKNSMLVYWASDEWEPHVRAEKFVKEYKQYKLGKKRRKLVFMKRDINV